MNWKLQNKMACLCFTIVLLCIINAFAEEVPNKTCDECTAEGYTWCMKNINKYGDHCYSDILDNTCPGGETAKYQLIEKTSNNEDSHIRPLYAERTLSMKKSIKNHITITYNATEKREASLDHTSKFLNARVLENKCGPHSCEVIIEAKPESNFCAETKDQFVDVDVIIAGFQYKSRIRYYVSCSCLCSKDSEVNSPKCNMKGNYTCGACQCNSEWGGLTCEKRCERGDIGTEESCKNMKYGELVTCSGNGKCVCGECVCDNSLEGSQYFVSDEVPCSDLCMQTMECTDCLVKGPLGECTKCSQSELYILEPLNTTIAAERDYINRSIWVHCETNKDQCSYNYFAKEEMGNYYVMMESSCNDHSQGLVVVGSDSSGAQVPLILGILGLVAVVATVGGILLWKHLHAMPPVDPSSPQYQNIGPTDCEGINPLYKPPTSSFKNPMFGKS